MKREELLNKVLELVKDVLSEEAIEEIKDYSKEDLELLLEDLKDVADLDEEIEEPVDESNPEIIAGWLACQEEEIRQRRLYEEEMPELSEETLDSELFNDMITMAESVVAGVRVMVEGGIDYNTSIQLASQMIMNKHNLEIAKHNCIQIDKNQI